MEKRNMKNALWDGESKWVKGVAGSLFTGICYKVYNNNSTESYMKLQYDMLKGILHEEVQEQK